MNPPTSIKSLLASGQQVNVFAIGAIPSPKIIELVALVGGYQAIWIDEEHAGVTLEHIETLAMACRSVGLDSYVRVAPTDYASIMRPMEAGVGGIMAAQVRSVAESEQIVRWAKFPPRGERGANASNFEGGYGTKSLANHIRDCNEDRWLSLQIETLEALDQVEQIAAIDGVDNLFVGPADLSVALGVPGDFLHPKCREALQRVSQATLSQGKTWGILVRSHEHADFCRSLGCQFYAYANELAAILAGLRSIRASYDDFFITENRSPNIAFNPEKL